MSVDPEIFEIFQHKVVQVLHFARVTEMRHLKSLMSHQMVNFASIQLIFVYG